MSVTGTVQSTSAAFNSLMSKMCFVLSDFCIFFSVSVCTCNSFTKTKEVRFLFYWPSFFSTLFGCCDIRCALCFFNWIFFWEGNVRSRSEVFKETFRKDTKKWTPKTEFGKRKHRSWKLTSSLRFYDETLLSCSKAAWYVERRGFHTRDCLYIDVRPVGTQLEFQSRE